MQVAVVELHVVVATWGVAVHALMLAGGECQYSVASALLHEVRMDTASHPEVTVGTRLLTTRRRSPRSPPRGLRANPRGLMFRMYSASQPPAYRSITMTSSRSVSSSSVATADTSY
jgi:hypothetical protein